MKASAIMIMITITKPIATSTTMAAAAAIATIYPSVHTAVDYSFHSREKLVVGLKNSPSSRLFHNDELHARLIHG
jgi:hypothetical protein